MGFIDSHAHLTDRAFQDDLDAVISRAQEAGVERILTLGTDVRSSRAAVALAASHPGVFAAVGIHPEAVREAAPDDLTVIRELAAQPGVVAIGEIGLDYYWDKSSKELQQEFFERQLGMAAQLGLAVSIHDRDAHPQILETLKRFQGPSTRGVLHAFSGDGSMAVEATNLGFLVSFAGPVTFLNARKAPETVGMIALDKMLIETDSPYLSPHPFRGRRNEPARVVRVAERIAELKGCTIDEVAEHTTRNARALFGI